MIGLHLLKPNSSVKSMLIRRIHYPVTTLGPGSRLVIWTMGCHHGCKGCIAEDTWAFDEHYNVPIEEILIIADDYIKNHGCHQVTISGGEPLMQKELFLLLEGLKEMGVDDLLVYSGFTYDEIIQNDDLKKVIPLIDVLIDGRYLEALNDDFPLRGSSNQKIIFFNETLLPTYQRYLTGFRDLQFIQSDEKLNIYGIVSTSFLNAYHKIIKKE